MTFSFARILMHSYIIINVLYYYFCKTVIKIIPYGHIFNLKLKFELT